MSLYHQLHTYYHNGHPLGTIIINHLIYKFHLHQLVSDLCDDISQTIQTQWLGYPSTQNASSHELKEIGLDIAEDVVERVLSEREQHLKLVEDLSIEGRLARGDSRFPLTYLRTYNRLNYRRRFY